MANIDEIVNLLVNIKVNQDAFNNLMGSIGKLSSHFRETTNRMREDWQRAGTAIGNGVMKYQKDMKIMSKSMNKDLIETGFENVRDANDNFIGSLSVSKEKLIGIQKHTNGFQTKMGKLGNGIRMATAGMKGFKMEMLGVMFFGMAMQRTFSQMLRPSAELFGIFELWGTMLELTFLPIIEALFPLFLKLFDFFINMPKEVKIAIGIFAILGLVFGTILFSVGQLVLGIGSLIVAFGPIGQMILGLSGIGPVLTALLPILSIVGIAVATFFLLWKSNLGGFQSFIKETFGVLYDTIKNILGSVWNIVKNVFGLIINIISGDWDAVWENIKETNKSALNILISAFIGLTTVIYNSFAWLVNGLKDLIIKGLVGLVLWGIEKILSLVAMIPGVGDKMKGAINSMKSARESVNSFADKYSLGYITREDASIASNGLKNLLGTQTVNITNNIQVSDKQEMQKMIDQNNSITIDKLARMVNT